MRVKRTWNDNWNDVIRNVIFQDDELKDLMLIPENEKDDIIAFIERYFIEDAMADELLTNEKVRICYYGEEGTDFGSNHIRKKYISFDIYVHRDQIYASNTDALKTRTKMIAQRLKELLTDRRHVENMSFTYEDDYNLGTKTVGYVRHHITFSYLISHGHAY